MPKNFLARARRWLSGLQIGAKQAIGPLVALVFLTSLLIYRPYWNQVFARLAKGPQLLANLTKDPADSLRSTNGRTNILLLGMGGAGHEAGDLTDSMILISYSHTSGKLSLISIPRDLWVDSMKAKINTAYYYGELRSSNGGGLVLSKAATEEIIGLPVHYSFALDFTGFKQAIDLVGGVDINVQTAFDDNFYPIPGKENAIPESDRYEHLHFDAGVQHMDGERALKFVRSRHAEGDEGTDFARSARQRLVILAFKDKVLSSQTLLNPTRITELVRLYSQYLHTDIDSSDYGSFARLALEIKPDNIQSIPLTTGDEKTRTMGILEIANKKLYQGQYVLIPKDGNWAALKQYILNALGN
jgi:LCP family protein required for cell wall assembly